MPLPPCVAQTQPPLANNPHADSHIPQPLMNLQPQVEEILLARTIYVKKLIEECNNSDDTARLLKVLKDLCFCQSLVSRFGLAVRR